MTHKTHPEANQQDLDLQPRLELELDIYTQEADASDHETGGYQARQIATPPIHSAEGLVIKTKKG